MPRLLNLNTATADELRELPGIGIALADRIVNYRDAVGRIRSHEELIAVAGISENVLDRFRDRIDVGENGASAPSLPPTPVAVTLDGGQDADFTGHRVVATFTRQAALPAGDDEPPLTVPSETGAAAPANGKLTLTFPNRAELIGVVTFRVNAPDGELLATSEVEGPKLPDELVIEVKPKAFATVEANTDPAFGRPTRLRGRVIDAAGRRQIAQQQVVIWGAEKENPQPVDFRALVVAQTDNNGYFSGPYPLGDFTAARGDVAIGEEPIPVPIHLEDDQTFPASVILVVDLPETAIAVIDDECEECGKPAAVPRDPDMATLLRADGTFSTDPGAGQCVDFTKPDRTLEEFRFSYVVRTTEPAIKGLTLDEPAKIDLSKILDLIRPNVFSQGSITAEAVDTDVTPVLFRRAIAEGAEQPVKIDANILHTLARDPDGFSLTKVATAANLSVHKDLIRAIGLHLRAEPGRSRLTCDNAVDWDDDPTIYQACTISHGHVLNFKQEWVADGYSMGNLLYSLPLAPGQKKQIAVVDWERREVGARTEALEARDELDAAISRDRDINEIVSASVNESVRGGSSSSAGAFGGGLGIGGIVGNFGGLLGIGGGMSSASSNAWQNSSRNTAASALNSLRDRTIQSASSLRSQRSTVVQTVSQGERVTASTESVANYNHCHAITIQYFEVLRHLLVRQRLTDVQECLFVPLLMSRFTSDKALRWRHTLKPVVRDRRLRGGFDALERIDRNYVGSDFPNGRYADQLVTHLEGELKLRFKLARPKDKDDDFDADAWVWAGHLFPFITPQEFYKTHLKDQQFKDRVFFEQLAPQIAESFVQHLKFFAVDAAGTRHELPIDPTLVSNFVNDRTLTVTLRLADSMPALTRTAIEAIEIDNFSSILGILLFNILPAGSKVIVEGGDLRYRTPFSSDYLFRSGRILNDLTGLTDRVRIATPLNRQELRNPKEEDKELSRQLLDHLNEHIERYHHAIWWLMSPDRRFMLLDGFEAPNSNGRSVASVVQNELIGIVGNCLVMPVAPGFHLDPTFKQDAENPVDLLDHYEPTTPVEPMRIAVPTRGVYAESVMGACNSCEFKEEERFWRWEESPIPDSPTGILPVSTETRQSDAPDLTPQELAAPIIAMQNAPAAPDPTGLAAAMQLLGTPNLFKDITGLEGTQKNAAAALEGAFDTAQFFGGKAADLALQAKMGKDIDKAMRTIQTAKESGLISDDQAKELTSNAIRGMIGGGTDKQKGSLTEQPEVKKLIDSTSGEKQPADSKVRLERKAGGETEAVDIERSTPASILGALFGAGGGKPKTIGKRSSKADAIAHITKARASTATSPWKLDRTKTLDRLEQLVNDPDLVDQDSLNLCGPAAFLRIWLARDPLAVAEFATELYDTGKSTINSYEVEPSDDSLIAQDYNAIKTAHGPGFAPEADWMIMGSLRDAENFFFDFEGTPDEDVSGMTTPGELAEYMEATNLYATVKDEGNFFLTKGISHALGLKPSPTRDIALLINAHMLTQMNVTSGTKKSDSFILGAFPNHFVVLMSEIKETSAGQLNFSYWTWGQQYTGSIDKSVFEANYYGAVIGEGAAP